MTPDVVPKKDNIPFMDVEVVKSRVTFKLNSLVVAPISGSAVPVFAPHATTAPFAFSWSQIAGGAAIRSDGSLFTWGYNAQGGLGICNRTSYSSPKQVGALTNWSQYSTGGCNGSLAVKTNGTLWSWGSGSYGGLGQCSTNSYSSPKQVGSVITWTKIGAGSNMAHGLRTS